MMIEAPVAEPEVAEPETQPALVPPDPEEAPPAKTDAPEHCGARHKEKGWICEREIGHKGVHEMKSGQLPRIWYD